MSHFDPRERNLGKIRKALVRFFPERQIIMRTGGHLRTLRLGSTVQLGFVLSILALCGWFGYSSFSQVQHSFVVAEKEAEVEQSRAAYNALMTQVSVYRDKISDVAQELERDHSRGNGTSAAAVKSPEAMVPGGSVGNGRGIWSASSDVPEHFGQLKSALDEGDESAIVRRAIDGAVSGVPAELAKNEAIAPSLEREKMAADREKLKQELARLDRELAKAATKPGGGKIDTLDIELRKVMLQRDIAESERGSLRHKIGELEARLSEMETSQVALAQKFSVIADDRIDEIRDAIKKTGLNVDSVLKSSDRVGGGRGGPFIPVDTKGWRAPEARKTLISLNGKIETLSALQNLAESLPLGKPLHDWHVTSDFGVRTDPFYGETAIHEGIDMSAPFNSPVFSTAPGKVVYAGWRGRYGRLIEIDHGNGIKTRYAHLNRILVKRGDWVGNYSRIGQLGTSGRSTGPHLHYEVRVNGLPRNPEKFIMAGANVYKD